MQANTKFRMSSRDARRYEPARLQASVCIQHRSRPNGIYPKTKEPKALYDGSWSGWGARDDLPVEPKA
jgi:hypothetical protein